MAAAKKVQYAGWEEKNDPKKEEQKDERPFVSKADSVLGPVTDRGGNDDRRGNDSRRDGGRRDYDDRRDGGRREYDERRGGRRDDYDDRRGGRDYDRRDGGRREYDERRGGRRDDYDERRGGRDYDRRDGGCRDDYDDRRGGRREYDDRRDSGRRDDYDRRDGGRRDDYDRRDGGRRDYDDRRRDYDDRRGGRRDGGRFESEPSEVLILFGIGDMTNDDFRDSLAQAVGKFRFDCNVIEDRETRRSKGFGFVTFDTVEDAKEAKAMLNDGGLRGSEGLRVDFSKKRQPRY